MKTIQKIAHRGASGYAPENTMASFAKAVEMGAASIECDVRQTLDRKLVVIHDSNLKRVGGIDDAIADLKYSELARIDVGSWFDPRFRGERVPLLEDLLDLIGGKRMELQLEIKNDFPHYDGIEGRIVDLLKSSPGWRDRIVISSFDPPTLCRVRELSPKARLGCLVGLASRSAALKQVAQLNCESAHFSARRISAAWVQAFHAVRKKILVYTVNTSAELSRMTALGVDGVFTNYPDLEV